jgi:hypothetical protein
MCQYVWIQCTQFNQILQFHKIKAEIQDFTHKIRKRMESRHSNCDITVNTVISRDENYLRKWANWICRKRVNSKTRYRKHSNSKLNGKLSKHSFFSDKSKRKWKENSEERNNLAVFVMWSGGNRWIDEIEDGLASK